MMRNVYKIEVWNNERCPKGAIRLYWDADEGFGQYDLFINYNADGDLELLGDSEYMDRGEDKTFIQSLFESLLEKLKVIG